MGSEQSEILIRDAQPNDILAVSLLLLESFNPRMEHGKGKWLRPLLRLSIQADLQQRFHAQNHYYCCVVATCMHNSKGSERLVGTVEMSRRYQYPWPSSPQYTYISNLAVHAHYRRRGDCLPAPEAV